MQATNHYSLPVPKAALQGIDRSSSPAHTGKLKHAVDLVVPYDTPVLAAADGTVTFVRDDSEKGGPSIAFWYDSNFIVIQHPNMEYSRYDHLATRSAMVKPGQQVKTGQQIARVGTTGFTLLPHLHFQVFVFTGSNVWTDFETLPIKTF